MFSILSYVTEMAAGTELLSNWIEKSLIDDTCYLCQHKLYKT